MEPPAASLSWREIIPLLLFRPLLAVVFVLSIIFFGWFLAWKLVLVHVPLVQEIFGLRKKVKKQKPLTHHRFSEIYNSLDARSRASQCGLFYVNHVCYVMLRSSHIDPKRSAKDDNEDG